MKPKRARVSSSHAQSPHPPSQAAGSRGSNAPKGKQCDLQGCHHLKALHHASLGARPWTRLLGPNKAKIPGFTTFTPSPAWPDQADGTARLHTRLRICCLNKLTVALDFKRVMESNATSLVRDDSASRYVPFPPSNAVSTRAHVFPLARHHQYTQTHTRQY